MLIIPYCCESIFNQQNETFYLCNCTMARCIENNTIEIIPYECPPLVNITCTNGKEPELVYDEYLCCQHYVCDCECPSCKLNYLLFLCIYISDLFFPLSFQVCVKAGEIHITSHLMGCTTVTKETVHMSWQKRFHHVII